MISVKTYPKNKEKFKKIKKLAREVIKICNELRVKPIAYGGLVYFGYTKDKNASVHDIDFLVPERCLEKIAKRLKDKRIKYIWNRKKHDFKIYREGAKIELDSVETYGGGKINEFDFNGLKVKAVSLDNLTKTYKDACKESRGKHKQHVRRYKELLKLVR